MKNQYFGDVGDFGKYGLLTALSSGELNLGINWYLTKDDTKADGKYTEYLRKHEFMVCDIELLNFLDSCVNRNLRNVNEIIKLRRFEHVVFYEDILHVEDINAHSESGRVLRMKKREEWFEASLNKLAGTDLIFLDPDNGIETKSLSRFGKDSVKYVFRSEISRMISEGFSLVVYNHRDRSRDDNYKARISEIHNETAPDTKMRVLRFNRYSVRDYIILMQPRHLEIINRQLDSFLANVPWRKHFSEVKI